MSKKELILILNFFHDFENNSKNHKEIQILMIIWMNYI